jgi:hypothetical protein
MHCSFPPLFLRTTHLHINSKIDVQECRVGLKAVGFDEQVGIAGKEGIRAAMSSMFKSKRGIELTEVTEAQFVTFFRKVSVWRSWSLFIVLICSLVSLSLSLAVVFAHFSPRYSRTFIFAMITPS